MADLAVWQRTIVDEEGNVVPGAEVEVRREEDGSLATLYADRAGETPLANPLAADMSGFVRFFAQGDAYTITAVGAGSTRTWRFDPTGRLQEFDRVSEALNADGGADIVSARANLGTFSTVADVQNSHIPAAITAINTLGWSFPGDGGGALYREVASEPSHPGKRQSADGSWWELSTVRANVKMFGAKGDGTTDDTAAFQAAHDYVYAFGGGSVYIPAGTYRAQGIRFKRNVQWVGAGSNATIVKVIDNPTSDLAIFLVENDGNRIDGIAFRYMSIIGDGGSSWYVPSGATVPGIDFSGNADDEQVMQCVFDDLFFGYCTIGLNLHRAVRYAPVVNCRFWYNDVGFHFHNAHPYLGGCEFRYNDTGVTGMAQDMHIVATRWSYNRVGWNCEIARSNFTSCVWWQNREIGATNINAFTTFTGCIFRGAGTFWTGLPAAWPNDSTILQISSRGVRVVGSFFWGGNGTDRAAIELINQGPQWGISISDCVATVDTGHFIEKMGGAISGLSLVNNDFLITSLGDGQGAMILRVPDNSGDFTNLRVHGNYFANEDVTQTHEYIEIDQNIPGRHSFIGNTFHPISGTCGGIKCANNGRTSYIGNTFVTGYHLNRIDLSGSSRIGLVVQGNPGFTTESSGTATILANETEVLVPHGLDVQPLLSAITVMPNGAATATVGYWVDQVTSTHFRLRVSEPRASGNYLFSWQINAHRFI